MFEDDADYAAFEKVLRQATDRSSMRLLAYCLMPNHWHLVLRPRRDGDLSRFVGWLTLTHTQRWHAHRHDAGTGHVYQGRYKSFMVDGDEHFLTVCRYVERNGLRAGLTRRAENWRWSSLWCLRQKKLNCDAPIVDDWPVDRPRHWVRRVNQPEKREELEALRRCVNRGRPYGREAWVKRMIRRLNLQATDRTRGRPRISGIKGS